MCMERFGWSDFQAREKLRKLRVNFAFHSNLVTTAVLNEISTYVNGSFADLSLFYQCGISIVQYSVSWHCDSLDEYEDDERRRRSGAARTRRWYDDDRAALRMTCSCAFAWKEIERKENVFARERSTSNRWSLETHAFDIGAAEMVG